MGLEIDTNRIGETAWGKVDKGSVGRALATAYAAGEIDKAAVREAYAYVPDEAFGEDADGKPVFHHSKAWGLHHELADSAVLVNPGGLDAVTGSLGKASLEDKALAAARAHIRKHYKSLKADVPESLKESLRRVGPGKPLEELVKGSLEYTEQSIREAFNKQLPALLRASNAFEVNPDTSLYVVECFADFVVVHSYALPLDEFYMAPFTIQEAAIVFSPMADWEIVELSYQPKAAQALESKQKTPGGNHKRFTERLSHVQLLESAAGEPKRIKAIGITAGVINGNGRRYPVEVIRAAVDELQDHLNESAGQGRLLVLGEVEHPSEKGGRPNLLETVVKWESVTFDGQQVLLNGRILETSKGKDILAIMEGGVLPGVSQRGAGKSRFIKENGVKVEEITELRITGYDLVIEPSDPTAAVTVIESVNQGDEMNPEELAAFIKANPNLFQGVVAEEVQKMNKAQQQELEEKIRTAMGVGKDADLFKALTEAVNAQHKLEAQERQAAIDAAVTEGTKDLPYGDLNKSFVEAVQAAKPDSPEAVKALVESKRKEYDAIVAQAKLAGMGFKGVKVLGPVLEKDTDHPEYAQGAWEFTEALVKRGLVPKRDLKKPASVNEIFTAQVLERFDAMNKPYLVREMQLLQEAEQSSDLSLPYSVSRAVIAAAFPNLVAASVFDVGVTDQTPSRLYYETFAADDTLDVAVTSEDITAHATVLKTWIALANKRVKTGTVVLKNSGETVTYVEGTDYVVDYANGKVMPIATITTGQNLKCSYSYMPIRRGENQAVKRGKMTLAYKTLDIAADRLATQLTREAIVFSRSQIGWDATTRTINGLINEIRRKIDGDIFYKALASVLTIANNSGGTWTSASDPIGKLVQLVGYARVKVSKRYYEPTAVVMSISNSDEVANWEGFTAAGQRPDADLNAAGYTGRLKGLPAFGTTEFTDGYVLVVNRELVAYRVFQAMQIQGPFPSYDGSGNIIAADQYYAEEFNGTDSPVPEKGAYVKVA